ncbi:MafB-like protein [Prevotella intermedia]|uniref:polymorphic toxin-type HINT domain-containing protein n=1 Tax=Prevotella intermedia TaxID=28131 RepID=UPI0009B9C575|nr:polymorphic toxin-type HINT domain-containing protein [Prevotella intermedia]ATV32870.1 MafB-like protein [Prevotella intermedia]ATV40716.1 MafB-like protein [Prevotella intermedia]
MAEQLEYIVKDALVVCDKGAAPGFFLPTHNTHVKIQGCLVANKLDKVPIANIPSFGICSITQKPCVPNCTEWQKTYRLKVKGQETLLFRSEMPCGLGGKIKFVTSGQVPLPPDALEDIKALQEQGAQENDEGWGWLDAVELVPVIGSIVGAVREGINGNWGLMAMNIGFLALDIAGFVSFGATTAASSAGKAAAKTGVKMAAKSAAKKAAKEIGKSGIKVAEKLTAKGAMKTFTKSIDKVVGKASAGKVCVFACFPAGTVINTSDGLKAIEDLKVGDKVWSYNEQTGELGLQEILQTMSRESDHTIELYTEHEKIETTAEHPFHTNGGWKEAADLQKGDVIKGKDENIEIKDVKVSYKSRKVYNFEVSNWHTYFVGALAWLAHNAKKCLSGGVRKLSNRLKCMGRTPGKNSKTGREVFERMLEEKPPMAKIKDGRKFFRSKKDGKWYDINKADMSHKRDAVDWWNNVANKKGYKPKGKEVREWMKDPDNYYLEHRSYNRSAGAKLRQTYDNPTNP